MSASPTTVPAVKAKLVELFKSATSSETTEVWATRPNEDHQMAENVYLGAVQGSRKFATLTPTATSNSREEEYDVTVEVEVIRDGTDTEGTETRLWELAQALELAVAEHRGLEGLNNVQWGIASRFAQHTQVAADGVLSNYTFAVTVVARI